MRSTFPRLALAALTIGLCTATFAQPASAPAEHLARSDVSFLKQAAENGHAEIESSKLAETKASKDSVKTFAKQMVTDHTQAAQELSTLAAAKGVKLPDGPSLVQKGKLKLLSASEGAKFDERYADQWGVKAHEDTVKLFQKAANEAKDPEVKAWASKTLPTLQQHLQHANELKATVHAKN